MSSAGRIGIQQNNTKMTHRKPERVMVFFSCYMLCGYAENKAKRTIGEIPLRRRGGKTAKLA